MVGAFWNLFACDSTLQMLTAWRRGFVESLAYDVRQIDSVRKVMISNSDTENIQHFYSDDDYDDDWKQCCDVVYSDDVDYIVE